MHAVLQHMHKLLPATTGANDWQTGGPPVHGHLFWQAECMHGWQAGLLRLVHAVLQNMHVLLPANTGVNDLQTGGPHVQARAGNLNTCWEAEKLYIKQGQEWVAHSACAY